MADPLILDATTQPGWTSDPIVELNGASAGVGSSALRLSGGGSTVKGLLLDRFNGAGIVVTGAGGNTIAGNRIGTDAAGNIARTNSGDGVRISGSPSNVVGGTTAGAGNVISGNNGNGDLVEGAGATGNLIQGNTLGTNAAGAGAIANIVAGVAVTTGAAGNVIGGAAAGAAISPPATPATVC